LWQRLYLRPLPHQQGSLACGSTAGGWALCSIRPGYRRRRRRRTGIPRRAAARNSARRSYGAVGCAAFGSVPASIGSIQPTSGQRRLGEQQVVVPTTGDRSKVRWNGHPPLRIGHRHPCPRGPEYVESATLPEVPVATTVGSSTSDRCRQAGSDPAVSHSRRFPLRVSGEGSMSTMNLPRRNRYTARRPGAAGARP
jgi:hypothetical protein